MASGGASLRLYHELTRTLMKICGEAFPDLVHLMCGGSVTFLLCHELAGTLTTTRLLSLLTL